jgi:endonuclease-3
MAGPRSPKGRAAVVRERLADEYPGSAKELCALRYENPYELLVATILSAQCTDARVNMVTPDLFATYPDPPSLATADLERVEEIIRSTGFFRAKARSLTGMAQGVVERFGGVVPEPLDDLVTLPGVGRKTANVVRSVAFGLPGLPVDTHVGRLSRRLGLTTEDDPVRVELDLNRLVPAAERGAFSLRLILHGRKVCTARKPHCTACLLADICPSAAILGQPSPGRPSPSSGRRSPSPGRPSPGRPVATGSGRRRVTPASAAVGAKRVQKSF